MVKRIFVVWLVANFVTVGLASAIARQWYIGWAISPLAKMGFELVLLMLPNLILPIIVLKYCWGEPVSSINSELGWIWNRGRSVLTGTFMFVILFGAIRLTNNWIGKGIPYNLPGTSKTISAQNPLAVVGLLLSILWFVVITVVGEETMFRGLVQTQIGKRYGA